MMFCHLILIKSLSSIIMPHYCVHYYYKQTDVSGVEVTSPNSLNNKFQKLFETSCVLFLNSLTIVLQLIPTVSLYAENSSSFI